APTRASPSACSLPTRWLAASIPGSRPTTSGCSGTSDASPPSVGSTPTASRWRCCSASAATCPRPWAPPGRACASPVRLAGSGADRFEREMLCGIGRDLHAPLRDAGVALRVLVPFGEDWYGYFMRRLAERPANLLFLLRHLR